MRLNNTARDMLAAEYVLGTLAGKARLRFEKLLRSDRELQQLVEQWSARLDVLGHHVPPVPVPGHVWQAIKIRLNLDDAKTDGENSAGWWWQNLVFWRTTSLMATVAAILLAVYIALPLGIQQSTTYVAVLNNEASQSSWLIKADVAQSQLIIQSVVPQTLAADRAFELWLLPADNQAPRSIGLVDKQRVTSLSLSASMLKDLPAAAGLAISLEPTGGSPTGQPTGPVLYQGKVQIL